MASIERNTHNRNPRCAKMEKKLIVTCGSKRIRPKSETLASKLPKNPIQGLQSTAITSKSLIDNWIERALEELEETCEKMKRGNHLKSQIPTNLSTGRGPVDCLVNALNNLTFHILFISRFLIRPPFSVEIPIFYTQCQGNFDFYMSIWSLWHEIHAIRRYIHQKFIKQSLDQKEITPSCLLISKNCSSLRGFVRISANWSFMLTNLSVMSPFCAWFIRKWCLISICLVLECCTRFFLYIYGTSIITFNRTILKR